MDGIEGALRLVCAGRGYADKVSVAHDDYASQGPSRAVITGDECCAERRRAQHFAVQHSFRMQIGGVLMFASDKRSGLDFRNGFPRNRPLRGGSDRIFGGEILGEGLAAREFRILQGAARGGIGDFRVCRDQSSRRNIPFLGGGFNE